MITLEAVAMAIGMKLEYLSPDQKIALYQAFALSELAANIEKHTEMLRIEGAEVQAEIRRQTDGLAS